MTGLAQCQMSGCDDHGIWTVTVVTMPDDRAFEDGVAICCGGHLAECVDNMLELITGPEHRLTVELSA